MIEELGAPSDKLAPAAAFTFGKAPIAFGLSGAAGRGAPAAEAPTGPVIFGASSAKPQGAAAGPLTGFGFGLGEPAAAPAAAGTSKPGRAPDASSAFPAFPAPAAISFGAPAPAAAAASGAAAPAPAPASDAAAPKSDQNGGSTGATLAGMDLPEAAGAPFALPGTAAAAPALACDASAAPAPAENGVAKGGGLFVGGASSGNGASQALDITQRVRLTLRGPASFLACMATCHSSLHL